MKNISISQVVRAHQPHRLLFPVQSWNQLMSFLLTLAFSVGATVVLFNLVMPTAPPAFVVIPAIVGGSLPLFAVLPARLVIATRFHAQHLTSRLDESIRSLGYARDEERSGALRYQARSPLWLRSKENRIVVTVREHAIEIEGPIATLRTLQKKMAG